MGLQQRAGGLSLDPLASLPGPSGSLCSAFLSGGAGREGSGGGGGVRQSPAPGPAHRLMEATWLGSLSPPPAPHRSREHPRLMRAPAPPHTSPQGSLISLGNDKSSRASAPGSHPGPSAPGVLRPLGACARPRGPTSRPARPVRGSLGLHPTPRGGCLRRGPLGSAGKVRWPGPC